MLKAVIFDLDDTLLDWGQRTIDWYAHERLHLQRVVSYVSDHIQDINPPEPFYEAAMHFTRQAWLDAETGFRAPSLGAVLRQSLEWIGIPPENIDVEACLRAYNWEPVPGVLAYPDAIEVIPMLASHGIKIGLITNAYQPMWMRDRELEACGLLPHFTDCRISAADIGFLKPHPAIFESALQRLNIEPNEAVFVGDNPEADIVGPQGIGMRGVLRAKGNPVLADMIVPDGIIKTLYELLPLLDNWYPNWRTLQTAEEAR